MVILHLLIGMILQVAAFFDIPGTWLQRSLFLFFPFQDVVYLLMLLNVLHEQWEKLRLFRVYRG